MATATSTATSTATNITSAEGQLQLDSTAITATDGQLQLDSIPVIDLRHLTQSELYTLSLCSPPAPDPRLCDDIVIPKIDRSVFNESAGSRKQTYSRLRLAPAADSNTLRRRTPHLRVTNPSLDVASLPSDTENAKIVTLLKHLFVEEETDKAELVQVPVDYSNSLPQITNVDHSNSLPQIDNVDYSNSLPRIANVDYSNSLPQIANVDYSNSLPKIANVGLTGSKRKRGRPKKNENAVPLMQDETNTEFDNKMLMSDIVIFQNMKDMDKDIANRDGVMVDLMGLGLLNDPYGKELRRRTEGLVNDEQLMGFLKELNGQWGSRRKKKRIVDASEFGNTLPKGWKLLLSLKKKEGRVWVCCRRYISPNGKQFASCKEVSSYLLSLHGVDANVPNSVQSNEISKVAASAIITDLTVQRDDQKEIYMPHNSSSAVTSVYSNHEVQLPCSTSDLPKLHIGENFPCKKCSATFHEKDELLHHNLSSHKKKRPRGGQSITDGVIIKEGKFECQFCHKTFNEKHRYNGHIGAHVRNQGKNAEESAYVEVAEVSKPGVIGGIPQIESIMQASITSNKHDETTYSSQSKAHGEEVKEAVDVLSTKSDICLMSEVVSSNDEKNGCSRLSLDTHGSRSMASGSHENPDGDGKSSESCSPSLLTSETHIIENEVTEVSAGTKEPRQKSLSADGLLSSTGNAEEYVSERKCEDMYFRANECAKMFAGLDNDTPRCLKEERYLDNHSPASSIKGKAAVEEPGQTGNSTGSLLCLSGNPELSMVENYVEKGLTAKIEETRSHEVPQVKSSDLLFHCSSHTNAVNDDSWGCANQERTLEYRSFFPSAVEKTSQAEDKPTGFNSSVAESSQERSGNVFGLPNSAEALDKAFLGSKTYATTTMVNELQFNGAGDSRNNELSLGSSKHQIGSDTNLIPFGLNRYPVESPLASSGMNFENNFDMVFPAQAWESSKVDVGTSENKIMFPLGSTDAPPDADDMAGSIWGANEENVLQASLANTSTAFGQSSNSLGPYDLVSDKDEADFFKVADFEDIGPARSRPVEYSFMGQSSNSHALAGAPSYDAVMDQGFDSFWLTKDTPMPNVTAASQSLIMCVWCGNEFYPENTASGAEGNAIGSLCPNCSASMQFPNPTGGNF